MASLATVLVLPACGSDAAPTTNTSVTVGPALPSEGPGAASDDSAPTVTPPAPSPTPTQTSAPPGSATGGPSAGEQGYNDPGATATEEASPQAQLTIDGVRVGLHDDVDRVVLDLSGEGEIGWAAEYVTDPVLDGSGAAVDLAGPFVLQVTLQGVGYPEAGSTAYEGGPLVIDGGDLTTVTEVLRGVPFEGQLRVYVGTTEQVPYRVQRLEDPARLVLDLQH